MTTQTPEPKSSELKALNSAIATFRLSGVRQQQAFDGLAIRVVEQSWKNNQDCACRLLQACSEIDAGLKLPAIDGVPQTPWTSGLWQYLHTFAGYSFQTTTDHTTGWMSGSRRPGFTAQPWEEDAQGNKCPPSAFGWVDARLSALAEAEAAEKKQKRQDAADKAKETRKANLAAKADGGDQTAIIAQLRGDIREYEAAIEGVKHTRDRALAMEYRQIEKIEHQAAELAKAQADNTALAAKLQEMQLREARDSVSRDKAADIIRQQRQTIALQREELRLLQVPVMPVTAPTVHVHH